ncbi:MAG: DUF4838 domain-containing protein [Candidatus Methanomethylophilaceae archaeon]|nr:DUF4838 domain-containing protein [Candidatus Methanomethylophilaceae archaeon]
MKLKTTSITSVLLCCAAWALLALQAHAALIQEGKSDYQIVLSDGAISSEVTAAKELQNFLTQITGVTLPIVQEKGSKPSILVGQSPEVSQALGGLDFASLKSDEIILKTVGKDIILCGERPRGSLYAVYELLETEFGVRFWSLDATDVPQKTTLELPALDHRYAPTLFYREGYYDVLQHNPQFAVRARNNGHCINIPEDWGGHLSLHGFCHTSDLYLPSKVHYKDHPEWYAFRDNRRNEGYSQLCLTNEEMRKALLAEIVKRLRSEPNTRILDLSQNDNQLFCQCEKCEAFVKEHGNQSDLLIDLVNYVAEAIEKEFPNVMVETLAYQYTRSAPKSIFPRKNVMIRLCSIECDFGRPLDSDSNRTFADDVRAWSKVAPVLFVWNYVTNFTKYYLPQPNWENLAGDIRFLLAHKVRGLFEQGSSGPLKVADLPELRAYLLSKLMWNPDRDENKIIQEFLEGFYGPAAPEIAEYLTIMKRAIAEHPEFKLMCYQNTTIRWLSHENLVAAWHVFEKAKAKVAQEPKFKERVEFAALPITFAMLERPETFWDKSLEKTDVKALIEHAIEMSRKAGTRIYSEGGVTEERVRGDIERLNHIFESTGPKPAFVKDQKWFAISAEQCMCGQGLFVFPDKDTAADGGKAARLPNTTSEWAVQFQSAPKGKYEIHLEVRCDQNAEGNAFTAGTYNTSSREGKSMAGKASEIAGKDYKTIKIMETELNSDIYFYVAPAKNEAAGNLWVDRLIFVEIP